MLRNRRCCLALALLLLPLLSSAETPAVVLDPVVVTGSRTEQGTLHAPFAVTRVEADALQAAGPRVNLSEALVRVPGLAVRNRHNYAQDLQINSRGFGARSAFGVRGLRLYVDGIPATAPDGQGQVSHFDLASAERIEVLRGPFSALYGNSSGGVIALYTRRPQETAAWGGVDFGSDGLRQQRVGGEAVLDTHWTGLAQYTNFEIDGFRPQSAADRKLGSVRLGYAGGRDEIIFSASDLDQDAEDPLGLTRAQFEADPESTTPQAEQFNTRKKVRQTQGGVTWRRQLEMGVLRQLQMTVYGGQREIQQWLAIPPGPQTPASHSGGVIDLDRAYDGVEARLDFGTGPWRLIAGVAVDRQDEQRRGFENFQGTAPNQQLGVTGRLRRDERNDVRGFDQYLQGEWRFNERWRAVLGLRHGETRFDSRDRFLANGDDSGDVRYDYSNPVAGLVYELAPQWTVYGSAARGFETPTFNELSYRCDGTQGLNDDLDAQKSRQFELGTKLRREQLFLDFAVFHAKTERELVTVANSGGRSCFGNAGDTRRFGAELAADWRFAEDWRALLALTWLDATYRDAFNSCGRGGCTTVPEGNRIPATTERSAYAELAWYAQPRTHLALEVRAQSDMAVNDGNSDFAAGHALLALRAEHRLEHQAWQLRTLARLDNLLDHEHAGSVIVNESNGRFFEPGAPRTWLVGATLRYRF